MIRIFIVLMLAIPSFAKECIRFDQAPDNIGKTTCVTGKVLKVAQSESGSMFLDFCENYKKCPFVVVVFRSNLKHVGDVRLLEAKEVEITGKIKEWRGKAEIVLKDAGQLDGLAEKLPPIPATYDADRHGSFSAGKYSSPRSKHARARRPSQPADEIDEE
jgi:hypothetical protein